MTKTQLYIIATIVILLYVWAVAMVLAERANPNFNLCPLCGQ
jgi:hypothetical protein